MSEEWGITIIVITNNPRVSISTISGFSSEELAKNAMSAMMAQHSKSYVEISLSHYQIKG
jgi:hypothetical protein